MKIIALSLVLFLCLPAQAQDNFTYAVSIQKKQAPANGQLLVEYELGGVKYVDSLLFTESNTLISRSLKQPVAATIQLRSGSNTLEVFLANNTISLTIDGNKIMAEPNLLQKEFLYLNENDRVRPQYFPLYGELNERKDSVGLKKLSVIFDSLRLNDIEKAKNYFDANKQTWLSLYAFNRFASFSGDYGILEKDFDSLPVWARESPDGKIIHAKIIGAKATTVGTQAKNFQQPSAAGNLVSLSDFKGKLILIDFWASWCGPCRKEHPALVKAYAQFSKYGFEIISVSLDNNKMAWLKAIEKDGLKWANVGDMKGMQNEAAVLYGVQSIPANFLIDPSGTILYKNVLGESLIEILNKRFLSK
ncbi:MAG: TlpA disulfide reductase family protein [Cyclobacteriaceae bacterium]|nr:TlpA disulfide reductase family protein [Cyclobacteriaceae bacterium]